MIHVFHIINFFFSPKATTQNLKETIGWLLSQAKGRAGRRGGQAGQGPVSGAVQRSHGCAYCPQLPESDGLLGADNFLQRASAGRSKE